jgi:hypothetical protein
MGCMAKKDQNLDETDREENFVIADYYNPIQGDIKQTSFSHSVRNQELQRTVKIYRQLRLIVLHVKYVLTPVLGMHHMHPS